MCVKGGYHLNVNEDEGVMEAAAVSRSQVQIAKASSAGATIEMVHSDHTCFIKQAWSYMSGVMLSQA